MCDIQGEFGLKDGRGILVVFSFFFFFRPYYAKLSQ